MKIINVGPVSLIHGRAEEVIPELRALGMAFDHVITDPPYEDHMHNAKAGGAGIRLDGYKSPEALDFASITDLRPVITPLMVEACAGWLLAFCTPEGIAPWRDAIEGAGARYKRACFWEKPDSAPQFNGQGPAMAVEAFVSAWCGPGVSKWNGGGRRNIWKYPTNPTGRDGRHPTEKPIALMADLIRTFTNPDDLILDPFAGSGSTLIAAAMTGRRALGIEASEKYFNVALDRLQSDILITGLPAAAPITCEQIKNLDLFTLDA